MTSTVIDMALIFIDHSRLRVFVTHRRSETQGARKGQVPISGWARYERSGIGYGTVFFFTMHGISRRGRWRRSESPLPESRRLYALILIRDGSQRGPGARRRPWRASRFRIRQGWLPRGSGRAQRPVRVPISHWARNERHWLWHHKKTTSCKESRGVADGGDPRVHSLKADDYVHSLKTDDYMY